MPTPNFASSSFAWYSWTFIQHLLGAERHIDHQRSGDTKTAALSDWCKVREGALTILHLQPSGWSDLSVGTEFPTEQVSRAAFRAASVHSGGWRVKCNSAKLRISDLQLSRTAALAAYVTLPARKTISPLASDSWFLERSGMYFPAG
jgi:hypothetical protein